MTQTRQFNVFAPDGDLIMTAPMRTIAATFGLRKEACDRIIRECDEGAPCELHFNGRVVLFGLDKIKIFG